MQCSTTIRSVSTTDNDHKTLKFQANSNTLLKIIGTNSIKHLKNQKWKLIPETSKSRWAAGHFEIRWILSIRQNILHFWHSYSFSYHISMSFVHITIVWMYNHLVVCRWRLGFENCVWSDLFHIRQFSNLDNLFRHADLQIYHNRSHGLTSTTCSKE